VASFAVIEISSPYESIALKFLTKTEKRIFGYKFLKGNEMVNHISIEFFFDIVH
jgi:hypothetical protein